ncbi:MAG: hypothetical protein V8R14_02360 [Clostridia bacterium]
MGKDDSNRRAFIAPDRGIGRDHGGEWRRTLEILKVMWYADAPWQERRRRDHTGTFSDSRDPIRRMGTAAYGGVYVRAMDKVMTKAMINQSGVVTQARCCVPTESL